MNGSDSSPNFDWLTKGAPGKRSDTSASPPQAFPFDPSDSTDPRGDEVVRAEETELISGAGYDREPVEEQNVPSDTQNLSDTNREEGHLLEEAQDVPDPVLNNSDGTTLIIRRRSPLQPPSRPVDDEPLREEFLAVNDPLPPTGNEDSNRLEETVVSQESSSSEEQAGEIKEGGESQTPGHSGDTATLQIKDLIPGNLSATFPAESVAGESEREHLTDVESVSDAMPAAPTGDSNLHHHQQEGIEKPSDLVESSGSAVIEETALPANGGAGDVGRTEVLRQEDLVKARESWSTFPSLVDSSQAGSTSEEADSRSVSRGKKKSGEEGARPHGTGTPAEAGPSRMFVILASYASAITIAFLVLLLKLIYDNGHPHQLESLPDVPVQKENELTYVAPYSGLPRGHTLRLGEKQRFGNIEVTPLAVIEDPIEFAHYSGDAQRKRPASAPVWKLKLLLKNVSTDQKIAPLDRRLVLRRVSRRGQAAEFTNYFITNEGTRDRQAPTIQIYRLPVDSDWDMAGQELGKVLAPGESYETYLAASEEETSQLSRHLVWRVQIRKGYSSSGNGVTTIFQVAFDKDQVTPKA